MKAAKAVAISLSALAFTIWGTAALTQESLPKLQTHENYIEEITRTDNLDIGDPMKVFAFVFDSLPERVKVYPTENYYYFKFFHNGTEFAGNIRIQRDEGDKVSLHFAYFETASEWRPDTPTKYIVFNGTEGASLDKIEPLVYRVTYRGKSVIFQLNDLSRVKPPTQALAPNEKFIGPSFDDSGVRFFLAYNAELKNFIFILDETAKPTEDLFAYQKTDRILIGRRTGFAFYRDYKLDRKILIGVFNTNVRLNNYFDGPFDQLPDNFIEGDTLRDAILEQRPDLKGRIDRFSHLHEANDIRYTIAPYLMYFELKELEAFHQCATSRKDKPDYYNCFVAAKIGFDPPEQELDDSARNSAGSAAKKRR